MNAKDERNYGIDLLRMVSMLMVVVLHVINWGGMSSQLQPLTLKGELIWFITIACWCAVNCYALISGYVGISSKHKYSSIIQLWLQVLFYSVIAIGISVGITLSQGGSINIKFLISNTFPFLFEKYWYFTAYVILFFFMPLLNFILDKAPRKLLQTMAIPAIILFGLVGLLRDTYNSINEGYSVLWLAIMYLCGGYIAKYNSFSKLSTKKSLLGYFICIILAFLSRIVLALITSKALGYYYRINFFIEYQSPLMVAAAVFLFNAFRQLKVKDKGKTVIRIFAPTAFGVYLIHENPIIRALIITDKFISYLSEPIYIMIGLIILTVLIIYLGSILIDFIRIQLFKLLRIKEFSNWIEKLFQKIFLWFLKLLKIDCEKEEATESNIVEENKAEIKE